MGGDVGAGLNLCGSTGLENTGVYWRIPVAYSTRSNVSSHCKTMVSTSAFVPTTQQEVY